jgi:asparagine synthase (glutamine-hydrolysing)
MCGIAGIYAPNARLEPSAVAPMLASMAHRGPDDRGVQVLSQGELIFGHLRLSILDLSPLGHQPMSTPDGKVWIVYNGEIYNFRDIRAELVSLGSTFVSDSDTEVILAAYRTWGLAAVDRFRGMFAFALWDDTLRQLYLCRDRFGVKPLFFSARDARVAFSSEMRGLICADHTARSVHPLSVCEFVQYGYISAPRSIFSDVQTVKPGCICTIDSELRVFEHCYWTASALYDSDAATGLRHELASLPDETLLDRVEDSLQSAFAYRMVADVPVGVFLSGGIDSSLVATLLAKRGGFKLRTFTIGFEASEFDESAYAQTVAAALGTEHLEFKVSPQSVLDTVDEIVDIADEPIGDSSLIPTLMVSRLARQHVKVALSADGADELFGGYARYAYCGDFIQRSKLMHGLYWLSAELIDSLPPAVVARAYAISRGRGPRFAAINDKLRKFVRMSRTTTEFDAYDAAVSEWSATEAREMVATPPADDAGARRTYDLIKATDPRDRFMHSDLRRYLPGDLLVKVDRASMAVSLEAREPFLDHEAAKVAAALAMNWKVHGQENKYVLRKLLNRHFPADLFSRPKQGFSAPIGEWLRGPLRAVALAELSPARVSASGILDPSAVSLAVNRFLAAEPRAGSAASVWILLQLQRWAGRWLRCAPVTGNH